MLLHVDIPCCFMRIIHAVTCRDCMLLHEYDTYMLLHVEIPCCFMKIIHADT